MRRIVILGSTGSVGENAVRVAAALHDRIRVVGVVGNRNTKRLAEQAALLNCEFAATGNPVMLDDLASRVPDTCRAYAGTEKIAELIQSDRVDMILCADCRNRRFSAAFWLRSMQERKSLSPARKFWSWREPSSWRRSGRKISG